MWIWNKIPARNINKIRKIKSPWKLQIDEAAKSAKIYPRENLSLWSNIMVFITWLVPEKFDGNPVNTSHRNFTYRFYGNINREGIVKLESIILTGKLGSIIEAIFTAEKGECIFLQKKAIKLVFHQKLKIMWKKNFEWSKSWKNCVFEMSKSKSMYFIKCGPQLGHSNVIYKICYLYFI